MSILSQKHLALVAALAVLAGTSACGAKTEEGGEAAANVATAGADPTTGDFPTKASKEHDDDDDEGEEGAEKKAAANEAAEAAEDPAMLAKEAKVSEAAARVTALKEVPGGAIESADLEREDGKLIWSFDISVKGKTGIDEVAIDALTGAFISKTHETPEEVAKEAAADSAAAKAKAGAVGVKKP